MTGRLELRAPAKVNLGLEVLRRRSDGFHELRTVFQSIDLADEITLEVGPGEGVDLVCDRPDVPADASNLAARAASAYLEAVGRRLRVRIDLRKRVPAGGGLGGGSSDAAAVLRGLDRLLDGALGDALTAIAAGLGSDVPFFLTGGTALAVGRGEEIYPLPDLPERSLVLVVPPLHVSTAAVYGELSRRLTPRETGATIRRFLRQDPWGSVRLPRLHNELEAAVYALHPELRSVRDALLEAGAAQAVVSGSGACVFGLFEPGAAAESAAAGLERLGHRCSVRRFLSRGRYATTLIGD